MPIGERMQIEWGWHKDKNYMKFLKFRAQDQIFNYLRKTHGNSIFIPMCSISRKEGEKEVTNHILNTAMKLNISVINLIDWL